MAQQQQTAASDIAAISPNQDSHRRRLSQLPAQVSLQPSTSFLNSYVSLGHPMLPPQPNMVISLMTQQTLPPRLGHERAFRG